MGWWVFGLARVSGQGCPALVRSLLVPVVNKLRLSLAPLACTASRVPESASAPQPVHSMHFGGLAVYLPIWPCRPHAQLYPAARADLFPHEPPPPRDPLELLEQRDPSSLTSTSDHTSCSVSSSTIEECPLPLRAASGPRVTRPRSALALDGGTCMGDRVRWGRRGRGGVCGRAAARSLLQSLLSSGNGFQLAPTVRPVRQSGARLYGRSSDELSG